MSGDGEHLEVGIDRYVKAAIVLILFLAVTQLSYPRDYAVGGGGWWICLDYVGEGALYSGDQTFCAQPPVTYYLGFVLNKVVGEGYLLQALFAFSFFSHLACFIVFWKVLKRIGRPYWWVYCLLYIFTVYRFVGNIASSISLGLFSLGFYLLYYRRDDHRGFASGVLFAAAIFTKYIALVPALLVIGFLVVERSARIDLEKRTVKIGFSFEDNREALMSLLAIALGFVVLRLVFPHIIEYTVLGQTNLLEKSLVSEVVRQLSTVNIIFLSSTVLVGLVAYCVYAGFFTGRELVFPAMILVIVAHGALFLMAFSETLIGSYYMLLAYPFLIVCLVVMGERKKEFLAAAVLVLLVFTFYYSTLWDDFARAGFLEEKARAVRTIQYGLHYIPPQPGLVLTQGPEGHERMFTDYDTPVDPGRVVVVHGGEKGFATHEDASWGPKIREEFNLSYRYSQAYGELSAKEKVLRREILDGRYSAMVYGPPEWMSIVRILQTFPNKTLEMFCPVLVPDFMYEGDGRAYTIVLLADNQSCIRMKAELAKYYAGNFRAFCEIGGKAEQVVVKTNRANGYNIKLKCPVKKPYKYSKWMEERVMSSDIIYLAILFLPVRAVLYFFYKRD